jgi:hypothetical protein
MSASRRVVGADFFSWMHFLLKSLYSKPCGVDAYNEGTEKVARTAPLILYHRKFYYLRRPMGRPILKAALFKSFSFQNCCGLLIFTRKKNGKEKESGN